MSSIVKSKIELVIEHRTTTDRLSFMGLRTSKYSIEANVQGLLNEYSYYQAIHTDSLKKLMMECICDAYNKKVLVHNEDTSILRYLSEEQLNEINLNFKYNKHLYEVTYKEGESNLMITKFEPNLDGLTNRFFDKLNFALKEKKLQLISIVVFENIVTKKLIK